MKMLTSIILYWCLLFSASVAAINVTCNVGSTNGMLKTAYTHVSTQWWEFSNSGFMYGMMISVDRDGDVRGEWAASGYKQRNDYAWIRFWIARTDFNGAQRKVLGSGGLGQSHKTCSSTFTQILW